MVMEDAAHLSHHDAFVEPDPSLPLLGCPESGLALIAHLLGRNSDIVFEQIGVPAAEHWRSIPLYVQIALV